MHYFSYEIKALFALCWATVSLSACGESSSYSLDNDDAKKGSSPAQFNSSNLVGCHVIADLPKETQQTEMGAAVPVEIWMWVSEPSCAGGHSYEFKTSSKNVWIYSGVPEKGVMQLNETPAKLSLTYTPNETYEHSDDLKLRITSTSGASFPKDFFQICAKGNSESCKSSENACAGTPHPTKDESRLICALSLDPSTQLSSDESAEK